MATDAGKPHAGEGRRPNLLIAGVQKGGTTWLHEQLRVHPDCFMSDPKELNYFNRLDRLRDEGEWQQYLANFAGATDERYVGESTPHYFWVKARDPDARPGAPVQDTPAAIDRSLGAEVTIIIILRDPVDRCESAWNHHFSRGRIDASTSVFDAPASLGLIDMGMYGRHAGPWTDHFGERIHFFRFDDLAADNRAFLKHVMATLDLDSSIVDTDAYRRLDAKVNTLEKLRARSDDRATAPPLRLSDDERRRLRELYRDDLEQAQRLTGLDLSAWLREA